MNKYNDIINMEYKGPFNHQRMSLNKRAFEFLPFSALSGYNESLEEVRKTNDDKKELLDESKEVINNKLNYLKENINNKPFVSIIYFANNSKKKNGVYLEHKGIITKIDELKKEIIIDNTKISFNDIYKIDI